MAPTAADPNAPLVTLCSQWCGLPSPLRVRFGRRAVAKPQETIKTVLNERLLKITP